MTRQELTEQKAGLIAYLLNKVKVHDFHAVQDAASDIREIDAKIEMINEIESTWKLPTTLTAAHPYSGTSNLRIG